MKILITGGAGFIGSYIVEAYLSGGHEVAVVDDLSTGFRHNVPEGVRLYEVDIQSDRAAEKPGWKPEISLQEGMRRTVEYFKTRAQ